MAKQANDVDNLDFPSGDNTQTESNNTARREGQTFTQRPSLVFFKPRKSGDGNAAIFEFNQQNRNLFLKMMPQKPGEDQRFDSDKSSTAKLGISDIGDMLACLTGKSMGCGQLKDNKFSGLYHSNNLGSTIINFTRSENDKYPGFILGISVDRDGTKNRYSIGLTYGESESLRVFLETYLKEMFIK